MSNAEEIIAWLSRYFVAHGMTELLFLAVGGAAIAPPTSLIEDIVPGEYQFLSKTKTSQAMCCLKNFKFI